ncbi:MAG: hypothetical protein R2795_14850 [Saprospiraceae bacterium]
MGNTVNAGVSALVKQANQLGLNVNDAENLNVQIILSGNMSKPKVGFKLLGTDGQTSVVASAKEEAKEVVKEQVDAVKGQVNQEVQAAKDRVTTQANQALDSAKTVVSKEVEKAGQQVLDQ